MKISVSMIVKNEENFIRRALESVKEADEIIVCDTGSTDRTIEIAKQYTDKVFTDYQWNDSFAEARNHAQSKCTGDYILIIDGDEYLQEGAMDRLRGFEGTALSFQTISEKEGQIHQSIRLYKNTPDIKWHGAAHNYLNIEPSHQSGVKMYYGYSDSHNSDPGRTFRILKKYVGEHPNSKRELYYLAQEYIQRRFIKSAIRVLRKYVKLSNYVPEMADAYVLLARCLYVAGDKEGASTAALKAVSLNPDFREALELVGDVSTGNARMKWHRLAHQCDNSNVLFVRNRQKIVVTMLSLEDYAGSGFKIVQSAREAAPYELDIEQIVINRSAYDIPCGQVAEDLGQRLVQERINNSDIIHFKGDWAYNGDWHGFTLPEEAKRIYTVGGSFFRRGGPAAVSWGKEPLDNYKADFKTATTPDLCYGDDWHWAPFPCLVTDYRWQRGEKFRIVHVPSDPVKKNTELLIDAVKLLKRQDVELFLVTNLSHEDAVGVKGTATIYADQFLLPVYGNSAVEAMSFGVPVLSWTKDMYNEDCPVISPDELTVESLAEKISEFLDWDKLEEVSKKTFDYVKAYHCSAGQYWAYMYKEMEGGRSLWELLQREQKFKQRHKKGDYRETEKIVGEVVGRYATKCLDVGCGILPKPAYMADGVEWTGIDPLSNPDPGFRFVRAMAEHLPFGEEFDGVLFATSLDHIQKPIQAIAEAYRVLKPGGHVIIWGGFRSEDDQQVMKWREEGGLVYGHIQVFTVNSTMDLMKDFTHVETVDIGDIDGIHKIMVFKK